MTFQYLLHEAAKTLEQRNVEDPSKEAGLLLSWLLGKDLGFIYTHPDFILEDKMIDDFLTAVERRGHHEPFAYITNECEFLSLSFEVNPYVLIPRPDTELLAEAALVALNQGFPLFRQPMFTLPHKKTYRVLDIGTGSGCLAISLAKNADFINVDAVDISAKALETAERNAVRHHVEKQVNFIQADFLEDSFLLSAEYDLVISNPPYIPLKDIPTLMSSVRDFEPHSALVGGEDGLVFYRALAEKVEFLLAPQGILVVECGFDQALQIQALFAQKDMETLLLKDLSAINRVVVARKKV